MAEIKRAVKCRYCTYAVNPWTTARSGKTINGMNRLIKHLEIRHPAEYRQQQQLLNTQLGEAEPILLEED